jgi:hypothetical protein
MATRKTRSRKQQSRKQKSQEGGARRKTHRKAGSWAKAVGEMYRNMKKENASVTLADAMKAASKARAAGKL